jgi:hypothetical protein
MTTTRQVALALFALCFAFASGGCQRVPSQITTGVLESPCNGPESCDSGVCIEWNGARFCSESCTEHADCAPGYGCAPDGTCVPAIAGQCHFVGDVCGEGTDPCCDGTVCVAWAEGLPATCSVACDSYYDCDNYDVVDDGDERFYSYCCVESVGACALEPYCS